jgi:cell division protein FtsI/penicillin-binding protein 2
MVKDANAKDWGAVDLATNAFGQGISVTPIQLITGAAAVANGGMLMRPYVLRGVVDPQTGKMVQKGQPQIVRQVISREAASTLRTMLWNAAENGETRGSLVPGYRTAGKTGTASIPVNGTYETDLTIASFVGMVPADDPQFVVLVKIDKPTDEPWGSLIAKPAFALIGQELTRYLKMPATEKVTPPTSTVPPKATATPVARPAARATPKPTPKPAPKPSPKPQSTPATGR